MSVYVRACEWFLSGDLLKTLGRYAGSRFFVLPLHDTGAGGPAGCAAAASILLDDAYAAIEIAY